MDRGGSRRYGSKSRLAPLDTSQMTWRETLILAAISALLAAVITVCVRIVLENLTF
jgi:hypothetical protein